MRKVIFLDYCSICKDSLTEPTQTPCSECLFTYKTEDGVPLYFAANDAESIPADASLVPHEDIPLPPVTDDPSLPYDIEGSILKEDDDGRNNI